MPAIIQMTEFNPQACISLSPRLPLKWFACDQNRHSFARKRKQKDDEGIEKIITTSALLQNLLNYPPDVADFVFLLIVRIETYPLLLPFFYRYKFRSRFNICMLSIK